MDIKLVIFDLDGVLVDACEWHKDALNEALLEVAGFKIEDEEHESTFNGIPTRKKLDILTNQKRLKPENHHMVYNIKQKKTVEVIEKFALPRREKVDLINYIKSRNIPVACFTNSISETATLMLDKTGVLNSLDFLLTNEDVGEPKPSPEGYIKTMENFNVKPSNTLIVEDSQKGVQAARDAGANVMVVKNPDYVNIDLLEKYL